MRGGGEGVVGVDGRKVEEQNVEVKERKEVVTKPRKRRVKPNEGKRCRRKERGNNRRRSEKFAG